MGNSVDTRIVELEFDNARFEEGVKTSLNTLQTLDQNLDFSKNVSGFEQLQSALKSTSFSGISNEANGFTDVLSNGLQSVMNVVDKIKSGISGIGSVGQIAAAALSGGLIGYTVQAGNNASLAIQRATFQLKGLGYTMDDVFPALQQAVNDTAYSMADAATAASSLLASGVQLDKLGDNLQAISAVAAMTNSAYSEISPIFTTIAGQGKMMTMQLRQLENRGLNVAANMANYFNEVQNGSADATESVKQSIAQITEGAQVTESDIRQMVTDGIIDFNIFADTMLAKFGEHAKSANDTFEGSWSNVKAVFSRIGRDFLDPFYEMRKLINQGLLGDVSTAAKNAGTAWRGPLRQLETFFRSFAPIFSNITNAIGQVSFKFLELIGKSGLIDTFTNSTIIPLVDIIVNGLTLGEDAIARFASALWDGFQGLIALFGGIGTYIAPFINAVKSVFDIQLPDFTDITSGFTSFKEWASSINLSEEAAKKFQSVLETILNSAKEVGETVVNVFTGIYNIVAPVAEALVAIAGSTIISGFSLLNDKLVDAGISLENLNAFVDESESIFDSFFTIFDTGNGTFENVANGIETIGDKFQRFFDKTENFKWVGDIFKVIGDAGSTLVHIFGRINDKFVEYGITFENIGKFFSSIWGYIKEFTSVFDDGLPSFEDFSNALGTLGTNFGTLFGKAGDKIGPFISHLIEMLGLFVGGKFAAFKEGLSNLPELISGLLPSFETNTSNLIDTLKERFKSLPKLIIESFTKGLSDSTGIAEAAETFGGLGESVDVLDQTFGQFVLNGIKNFIDSFGTGLDSAQTISEKIKTVFDTIGEAIGGLVDRLGEWASNLDKHDLFKIFSGIFTGGFLLGLLDAVLTIRDIAHGVKDVTGFFSELKDTLLDGLSDILGNIADAIGAYGKKIKAQALKEVAISIAILAGSLFLLSTIPVNDLIKAGVALLALSVLIGGLAAALTKISKSTDKNAGPIALTNLAGSLLMFSAALLLIAAAVKAFSAMAPDELAKGTISVAVAISALLVVAAALGRVAAKHSAEISGLSAGLIVFSVALLIMAKACDAFSKISLEDMGKAGLAILGLLGVAAILGLVADKLSGKIIGASVGLVIFSAALIVLGKAAGVFSTIRVEDIGKIALAMLVLAGGVIALGTAAKIAGDGNIVLLSVALLSLAGSLSIIAGVVERFSSLDSDQLVKGLLPVLGLIAAISVAMMASSNTGPGAAVAMIAMAAALGMLAGVVTAMGMVPFDVVKQGLIGMGVALAILLAAGAIAGLPLVSTGLITLAAAIAIIGVGIGAVGLGMLLFATSLSVLAAMAPASFTAIVEGLNVLLVGIVEIMTNMGLAVLDGILRILEFMASNAPRFSEAAITIGNAIFDVLEALQPRFAELGAGSITQLLLGIGGMIGEIAQAGVSIIVGFLLGVAASIGMIIQAGFEVAISFINGVADAIGSESNQAALLDALENLGGSIINALWNAITKGLPDIGEKVLGGLSDIFSGGTDQVETEAENMGKSASDSVEKQLAGLPDSASTTVDSTVSNLTGLLNQVPSITGDAGTDATDAFSTNLGEMPDMASLIGEDTMSSLSNSFDFSSLTGDIEGFSSDATEAYDLSGLTDETDTTLSDISKLFSSNTSVESNAKSLGEKASTGFNDGASTMRDKASSQTNRAVNAVSSQSGSANSAGYSVGYQVGAGMDSGMGSWMGSIESKARQMINAAKHAANAEAQVKSPSRVFARIGMYLDLGLVAGMEAYQHRVEEAGRDLSRAAINSTMLRAGALVDMFDDIDYNPVIRPVLDASQFKTDVNSLNGYFMRNAVLNAGYAGSRMGAGYLNTGDNSVSSTTVNITLDYNAGEDANTIVRQIGEALKTRNILEA